MATTVTKIKDPVRSTKTETLTVPGQEAIIAERAYYKAEKRGFEPGHELDDWFKALQECLLSDQEA